MLQINENDLEKVECLQLKTDNSKFCQVTALRLAILLQWTKFLEIDICPQEPGSQMIHPHMYSHN